MKKIVHKSAVPIYAAAVVWVLYALLFPLYRIPHFLVAAAASAVVFGIAGIFCKDVVEEVPEEPVTTGNAALDEMLADGDKALKEMVRLDKNIEDPTISAQIVRLEELSERIFAEVKRNPQKLPQIRKFMNYYLPTTLKLLNAYDRMSEQGVEGENITSTMARVRGMMGTIVLAFEKQLDSLFGDQALDISTDITVLENMMAREGLSDDPIHQTQQTAQQTPAPAQTAAADTPEKAEGQTYPPQGQEFDDSITTSGGIKLEL